VKDVPVSARFYIQHFGFQPRVELDWFTTLSHQDRPHPDTTGACACPVDSTWCSTFW
jgi:hypothetical protein